MSKICPDCQKDHGTIDADTLQGLCMHAVQSICGAIVESYPEEGVGVLVMLVNDSGIAINTNLQTDVARSVLKKAADRAGVDEPFEVVAVARSREEEFS